MFIYESLIYFFLITHSEDDIREEVRELEEAVNELDAENARLRKQCEDLEEREKERADSEERQRLVLEREREEREREREERKRERESMLLMEKGIEEHLQRIQSLSVLLEEAERKKNELEVLFEREREREVDRAVNEESLTEEEVALDDSQGQLAHLREQHSIAIARIANLQDSIQRLEEDVNRLQAVIREKDGLISHMEVSLSLSLIHTLCLPTVNRCFFDTLISH